jgi:sortase system peptidoglycan-associated protein
MKTKLAINALLIGAIATAPSSVMAAQQKVEKSDNKEVVGFGVGTIIGAVLGGPAGAFITGLAGSLMVKTANQADHEKQLTAKLQQQSAEQTAQVAKFKHQVEQLEQQYQRELLAQQQSLQKVGQLQLNNLLMSMQFNTGSSRISDAYNEQIIALAKILKQTPSVAIDLSGYTDKQGSAALNQALSEARANAVKTALVEQGIDESRISTNGYGDKMALVANEQHKASFYDRRVVIKFHQLSEITAKN